MLLVRDHQFICQNIRYIRPILVRLYQITFRVLGRCSYVSHMDSNLDSRSGISVHSLHGGQRPQGEVLSLCRLITAVGPPPTVHTVLRLTRSDVGREDVP
jgi:hypothetical protein